MSFTIKYFDDYHDIEYYAEDNNVKGDELGCFPAKNGPGYCVYFGVFWKDRKPSKTAVWNRLSKLVKNSIIHYYTGKEVTGSICDNWKIKANAHLFNR